jgi:hypothetical protein
MSKILQAVALAMADNCCCGLLEPNGECCMSDRARDVFAALEDAGGPSLAQCEGLAAGSLELRQSPCYEDGVVTEPPD